MTQEQEMEGKPRSRPRLLDLFCGARAGGAAMGYHRAGFKVTGVDHRPQPRYPFAFVRADALEYLAACGKEYDCIHASPPCQRFSLGTACRGSGRKPHADLLTPAREMLMTPGRPWVIENVNGAPMRPPAVMLCGLMFGLKVFRHRWFESPVLLLAPAHPAHGSRKVGAGGYTCVAGHGCQNVGVGNRRRLIPPDHRTVAAWKAAMGINWMNQKELAQAVPPDYTECLGRQLMALFGGKAGLTC